MASEWSLKQELCGLAKVRSPCKALWRLGVIGDPTTDVVLKEVQEWARAGDDTFIYRFHVVTPEAIYDLLLKAIVAFSVANSLTEITNEWVERRRLLAGAGIRTPTLYCVSGALLMEKYIPHKLSDFIQDTSVETSRLFLQVIQYAATLDKYGFLPISPFHSLRTDGLDVFAVDFGQDLGPSRATSQRDDRMLTQALVWLGQNRKKGKSLDPTRARAIYRYYANDKKNEASRWT